MSESYEDIVGKSHVVLKKEKCINCDNELTEVFLGSASRKQFQDALHVTVHLGYGEFRDQDMDKESNPQGNFCFGCSTRLIMDFPGFRKLVGDEEGR